jgi:hypothetical protein
MIKAATIVLLSALAGSFCNFLFSGAALAAEPLASAPALPSSIHFLPGASRAISHAASASRDTATLGVVVLPRVVVTGGADIAFFAIEGGGLTFRPGFFGMLELESNEATERFLPRAGEEVSLWRRLLGYSAALSFDRFAARALGKGGAIEGAVSYRHESAHFSGPDEAGAAFAKVPQMGDFIMVDLAVRAPFGRLEVETRVHYKGFVVFEGYPAPYRDGAGADVIVRWKALPRLHVFSSTFAEFLVGSTPAKDASFLRNLTGVTVPGVAGDLSIFAATDIGHGKGFRVDRREATFGGGLRLAIE